MERKLPLPEVSTIQQTWPLQHQAYIASLKHRPKCAHPMQPKEVSAIEAHTDFYVSPRMFIRFIENKASGFTYCDNFSIQTLITLIQKGQGSDIKTKIECSARIHIIKPIQHIQKLIMSQCKEHTKRVFVNFWNANIKNLLKIT